jgi:hypothetical protein
MSHHKIRLGITILLLSGVFELDVRTRYRDTSAVAAPINECQTVGQIDRLEGEGLLLREGMSDRPLTPGERLCAGDRVQLTVNARAMAICTADTTTRSFPVGIELLATSVCPDILPECDPNNDNPGCGRGDNDKILEPNLPHILSPRNTALLTTQPQIRWEPVSGASRYTVRVEKDGETVWGAIEVEGTKILYSGDIPLEAGSSYKLTVTTDTGATATSRFSVLNEAKRTEVMRVLAIQPNDAMAVIPARVYVYTDNLLFSEAIEMLENAIAQGDRSAAIYLQLGQLYQEIDLFFKAEEAYSEAIELATNEGNLKGQALAHVRLGQVERGVGHIEAAIDRLSQAKMLYEQAGDLDRAAEIETLLQEWQLPANGN